MTPPTPEERVCPDCGSDEISRHSFEECCAILKQQRDAMKAERDAAEKLVSAQHDALVAMKSERDCWEHRAEVAERENGEALSMLAFTGEPSSLWQAAAAARVKLDEAVQKARYESDVAAQAMAAKDAAVREAARVDSQWRELYLHRLDEVITLGAKLAEAEQERDDADDALAACQAQATGTIARLREALDQWEDSALNLLAVVHRDGGQHTATVGFSASCTEAEAVVVALRAALNSEEIRHDEVLDELEQMSKQVRNVSARLAEAERERDETVAGAEYRRKLLAALETRCAAAEAERDAAVRELADIRFLFPDATDDLPVYVSTAVNDLRAKLADAERERDRKESWLGEQADIISRGRAENAQLRLKLDAIREEAQTTIDLYNNNGPEWTSLQSGEEYYSASYVLGKAQAILDTARTDATAQGE